MRDIIKDPVFLIFLWQHITKNNNMFFSTAKSCFRGSSPLVTRQRGSRSQLQWITRALAPIAMNYKGPGTRCHRIQGPWPPLPRNTTAPAHIATEYQGFGPHWPHCHEIQSSSSHCHGIQRLRSPLPRNAKITGPHCHGIQGLRPTLTRNTKGPGPH